MLNPSTRYFLFLSGCYKSLSQNFIYWLSTYLFAFNYPQLSGRVTLIFVIPIYCGHFLIGKMHEDTIANEESLTNSNVFMIITSLITFGGLTYLSSSQNYIQFVIIIMIEGFVIGGCYNVLKSNMNLCAKFDTR
jgi:hypothetical protein